MSDTILYYANSKDTKLHRDRAKRKLTADELAEKYDRHDDKGAFTDGPIERSPSMGERLNLVYEYKGYTPDRWGWRMEIDKLRKLDEEGNLGWSKTGKPYRKLRPEDDRGAPIGSVWEDISVINSQSDERRGYPTQKPLALLERIIEASTDEGDVVLDPFAGCGTAIVAAERMGRNWIGIDITYLAINEVVDRLHAEKREGHPLVYSLEGTPKDEAAAIELFERSAAQNHKPFEQWAVTLVNGRYNEKRGKDRGIDGKITLIGMDDRYRECVIQVKGGNALTLSAVRDFANVIESNDAVLGIMISQREPTKEMIRVAELMGLAKWPSEREIPRFQFLTTEGILEYGHKPNVPEGYRPLVQEGLGKVQPIQNPLDLG